MPTDKEWMEAIEVAGIMPEPGPGFFTVSEFSSKFDLNRGTAKIKLDEAVTSGKMEKKIFRSLRGNATYYRIVKPKTKLKS